MAISKNTTNNNYHFYKLSLAVQDGAFYKLSLAMRDVSVLQAVACNAGGGGPSGAGVMHLGAVVEREDQMSGNLRAATCIMREMSK